jgi:CHAD domain-containing protein
MNCLDKYRSKLVRKINKDLRIILARPEEETVHDFRVGVKRLTALYYFLNRIDSDLKAKRILKPYRSLFKSIGKIRDAHIAVQLIQSLDEISIENSRILVKALRSGIRNDYQHFQAYVRAHSPISIRTPTVSSTGISARAILRLKPLVLNELLLQILSTEDRMNARQWHKKRILLKRYHHTMDAFIYCPGQKSDENELKQIKILEQLLGDWHDRVIATEILQSVEELEAAAEPAIAIMIKQERLLLGSARIYLGKFSRWHRDL